MKGILDKEMDKCPKTMKLRFDKFDYFLEHYCPSTYS